MVPKVPIERHAPRRRRAGHIQLLVAPVIRQSPYRYRGRWALRVEEAFEGDFVFKGSIFVI